MANAVNNKGGNVAPKIVVQGVLQAVPAWEMVLRSLVEVMARSG